MNPSASPIEPRRVALLAGLFALVTFAVYGRSLGHDFVNYDDPEYVYRNPAMLRVAERGLDGESLRWSATAFHSSNWHPLTWLSHQLDVALFGMHPGAHHGVSVALHALNALLCFLALRALTGKLWPSLLVAALFALHPLRVQSVAWISERKDVLSGTFFFLTLWTYARYARRRSLGRYCAVAGSLGAGLLAKQMLVTVPFLLLLLDFWPLERQRRLFVRQLLLEKLPLLALALGALGLSLAAQTAAGSISSVQALPLADRLWNAATAYGAYLRLTVWPDGLACFYPHASVVGRDRWEELVLPGLVWGGALVLISLGLGARAWRRRSLDPWIVGWLWYLGTLVPVIGLVQLGAQAYADRYAYLPLVGIYIAVIFGSMSWIGARHARTAHAALGLSALALVFLAARTWVEVGYWRDTETLNRRALEVTRNNYIARNNLGMAALEAELPVEAEAEFRRALTILPSFAEARFNLGVALQKQERVEDAIAAYEELLRRRPGDTGALINLGALRGKTDPDAELKLLREAAQADPENAKAWVVLGRRTLGAGELEEAAQCADRILALDAASAEGELLQGLIFEEQRAFDEALERFRRAVANDPELGEAHARLGRALARAAQSEDDFERARASLEQALRVAPERVDARVDLAKLAVHKGELERALLHLDEALERDPSDADVHDVYGVILLNQGDADGAERHLLTAVEVDPSYGSAWNNLGYLYETTGRNEQAIECYGQVIETAPRSPSAPVAARGLAWLLATASDPSLRDGARAVEAAELARRNASPQDGRMWEIAAAAYAEAGRFEQAAELQRRAVELERDPRRRALLERQGERYDAGESFERVP